MGPMSENLPAPDKYASVRDQNETLLSNLKQPQKGPKRIRSRSFYKLNRPIIGRYKVFQPETGKYGQPPVLSGMNIA